MYKKLTKNVAITIHRDRIYLHLRKYKPIVISAEDKFRKGIELKICAKCKSFQPMVLYSNKRDYCGDCFCEIMNDKNGE